MASEDNQNNRKELKLKVAEAIQNDLYRGIVRIDAEAMKELGIRIGDIVEIEGKKKTVAIAQLLPPQDYGLGIIRMDGIIRKNANATLGGYVTVRKAIVKEAQKVVLAPAAKGVVYQFHTSALNYIKRLLDGRPVVKGDNIVILTGYRRKFDLLDEEFGFSIFSDLFPAFGFSNEYRFTVVNVVPKGAVVITENTEIEILPHAVETKGEIPEVTYEDIGDMEEVVQKVRELVELPLKYPELFEKLGIEPPKGILLYGPPGTGKTLLAKAVANESGAYFIAINGPEIVSKYVGESEKRLRDIFEEANKNAPSIIFIDEIDAIVPKRDEAIGEVERRLVAQLLTLMDGLKSRGKVIVIAATNRPEAIDPALRRPGRFDREIEVPVPNEQGRYQILKVHTRNVPLGKKEGDKYVLLSEEEKDKLIKKLASITYGYVGADLAALVKEAAMNVIRRILPEIERYEGKIPQEILDQMVVTEEDFMNALKVVPPSAMREVLVEVPKVRWEDVGGLDGVKLELKEAVEWPIKNKKIYEKLGIEPPKGILLYGPPGTGKTLLAKAVANESGAYFIAINGPEIVSKYVGESEKRLRDIFEEANKNAPSIIFIDEIDAIVPKRDEAIGEVERRLVAQLLTLMDGLKSRGKVIVIAATNRPEAIDPALRRPGRFDREIEVPVPNEQGRYQILKVHTRNVPLGKKEGDKYVLLSEEEKDKLIKKLASITYGYVGADLAALVKEAAMNVIRRILPEIERYEGKIPQEILDQMVVTEEDFMNALKVVPPSAMREVLVEVPKVRWEDVGGLDGVKLELKEAVEWPIKNKKIYEKLGIEPPKGILLYGPPGTGKTLLAKAIATEIGANFIAIKGPEIFSKWFGESEKMIREIFRKAKQVAPAVIFFDEIDAIAPRRGSSVGTNVYDSIVNQLLAEMDGITTRGDVIVIAATNRPDIIDPALLRPGRFDRIIYIPPPDYKARLEILKIKTRNMPLAPDVNLEEIARITEGYSGADLELLVKEAAINRIRLLYESKRKQGLKEEEALKELEKEDIKITMSDFKSALEKVKPSITKEMENYYKVFAETFRKGMIGKDNKYYG
ncbi:MAG: CDC48 family AAA ATPase [Candidatus Nanopusillus sp.]|nr:CDC48 family AAA ATPase [Candidatus Nanopusillus sp.]